MREKPMNLIIFNMLFFIEINLDILLYERFFFQKNLNLFILLRWWEQHNPRDCVVLSNAFYWVTLFSVTQTINLYYFSKINKLIN
jgi:hypothetical protein